MSTKQKLSHTKLLLLLVILMAAIATFGLYFSGSKHKHGISLPENIHIDGTFLKTPQTVADFQLTDDDGKPFTHKQLMGHWTMLFFGFSNCGYVCPTTLAALNGMYHELSEKIDPKKMPQIVMVSVDPKRDTVARMHQYVKTFNPNFIGTRADESKLAALKKSLHIVAVKAQSKDKNPDHYTITHSADVMLLDPNGDIVAYFSFPHTPDQMAKDYQTILKAVYG